MKNPNGYGNVVNLGKGRRKPFAVRITVGYTDEGKEIRKYIGYYPKRQDALLALAEYNKRPYNIDGRNKTFAEVYAMASKMAFREASPQKIASYSAAFKKCEALHNVKISRIKTAELQDVIDSCPVRSKSTLNNIKIVFHTVFKYAVQNDFIQKDYSEYVVITDAAAKKNKNAFSDEEIQILWQNSDNFYCRLTLILIYTGFRINELLTLRTENINLGEDYMSGGLKTKSGKNRIVPIHPRIRPFIEEQYNKNKLYLFPYGDDDHLKYSSTKDSIIKELAALNIFHTPHECRHTTASLLYRYGAKDLPIKRILGHTTGDLTKDVYTHLTLADLKQTLSLIP